LGVWLALVVAGALPASPYIPAHACGSGTCAGASAAPTEIVVKLHAGADIGTIVDLYPSQVVDALPSRQVYVLAPGAGQSVWSLIDAIEDRTDLVVYTEVDHPVQAPEGQPYSIWGHPYSIWGHPYSIWGHPYSLWGHSTSDTSSLSLTDLFRAQPALNLVRLPAAAGGAWAADVVIAVLDSGVEFGHPALAGRLTTDGYDFVDDDPDPSDGANGRDDDQDGQADEMAGHGTFVAGLASLIAPQARIMPLRVLDDDGRGRAFVLAEAIDYAVEHGADVVNLSLGTAAYSLALERALERANAQGVVVVAAAGNNAADLGLFPASGYKVVSVTATDLDAHKAEFANYGSLIDLAAPGVDLLGPVNGGYALWSGTSMSAPLVAGEAALLMGLTSGRDKADDVIACLEKDTLKVDEGHPVHGGKLGKGLIDVAAALACYQSYAQSH
jgi:hypothetical protein